MYDNWQISPSSGASEFQFPAPNRDEFIVPDTVFYGGFNGCLKAREFSLCRHPNRVWSIILRFYMS